MEGKVILLHSPSLERPEKPFRVQGSRHQSTDRCHFLVARSARPLALGFFGKQQMRAVDTSVGITEKQILVFQDEANNVP